METPEFKTEELLAVFNLAKENSLQVFIPVWPDKVKYAMDKKLTYFYFTDGKNIGYVQTDRSGYISISSVHKPCKEVGTGLCIHSELVEVNIKHLKDAFCLTPHWGTSDRMHVVKYADPNEFISKNTWCSYKFV